MKLTNEQKEILRKLTTSQLQFLTRLKEDKEYETFLLISNKMINIQKNLFFLENEEELDPIKLYVKHAFARGVFQAWNQLLTLIEASSFELASRENKRKEKIK